MIQANTTPLVVATVMTHCPISMPADAGFRSVAITLSGTALSALPVVDGTGWPVGVVSEVDLVRAVADGCCVDELTAGELMSAPARTVPPDEPLLSAARQLTAARVRRLFVVDDGGLAGVLSRRDVLATYLRDDDDVRIQVEREVLARLPTSEPMVRVIVRDGVVRLIGQIESRSTLSEISALVSAVPGVVEVRNGITYLWDDGATPDDPRGDEDAW